MKFQFSNGSKNRDAASTPYKDSSRLTSQDSPSSLEQAILEALRQGDKNRGELFDLTVQSYPILNAALKKLRDKKLIETYFVTNPNSSALTYRLHRD